MVAIKATPRDGYQLFMEGTEALSKVENNGIRIDTGYLAKTQSSIKEGYVKGLEELRSDKFYKTWKRVFGSNAKITSPDQLCHMLIEEVGYKPTEFTPTGKPKMDEATLERIEHPFVKRLLEITKLHDLSTDFLNGIERETVHGLLHPIFNLNMVETYRSSSDSPNFQNFPNRNRNHKKIVRKSFRPRKGRYWVSLDYSAIEVRVAYCYHKDPVMLKYLTDKSRDMHRDMAAQMYQCDEDLVSDAMRHTAKNMFVFPQFYGSFYIECAKDMWNECVHLKIRLKANAGEDSDKPTGPLVIDYLKSKGIKELGDLNEKAKPRSGTFEAHVKNVEDDFWNRRFKVYTEWKKRWHRQYLDTGEFGMYTGFRVKGSYRRNQVLNYPIQGPAFHVMLKALIILQKEIERRKMKSLIIGQIHDAMECDVVESELQDFIPMAEDIMVKQVPKLWDWITVPLSIGVEVASPGQTWADKAKWGEKNGVWQLKA